MFTKFKSMFSTKFKSMFRKKILLTGLVISFLLTSCNPEAARYREQLRERIAQYEEVTLTADLSWLSE